MYSISLEPKGVAIRPCVMLRISALTLWPWKWTFK